MKCLFIGGPLSHQKIRVSEDINLYRAELQSKTAYFLTPEDEINSALGLKKDHVLYKRMKISLVDSKECEDGVVDVFALKDKNLSDVIYDLLQFYSVGGL